MCSISRGEQPAQCGLEVAAGQLETAIQSAAQWLVAQQDEAGFWCGELQGDTILESEYILLQAWLGREQSDVVRQAARYLLQQQLPSGGWSLYPGGPLEPSASVKAYLALKLTGHSRVAEPMRRARDAIRASGGADKINSFTRFYLALLGQLSYDHCPAVPPEMILLPRWAPVNIYRVSAWSRTILVPLSVIWAFQPIRVLPAERNITELFLQPPAEWPPLRCPRPSSAQQVALSERIRVPMWEMFFRSVDSALKHCERWKVRPLRQKALAAARQWMLERFEDSDGLGAIFPPIVWSIVALRCLGYTHESPQLQECHRQLDALIIEQAGTVRLQPCKSPVWDTALTVRALSATDPQATSETIQPAIDKACRWLLSKETRRYGDWSIATDAEASGWFFEHRNAFYPDVDDTVMVLMALRAALSAGGLPKQVEEQISATSRRGVDWVLAMQNKDGGWGAFDRDNDYEFLCHVPFADHNAMIDPSTPDITARVIEALVPFGLRRGDPVIDRGIDFLRATQEPTGSWFGRWGVNHIYGTWQVLTGLASAEVPADDPIVRNAISWLVDHQQPGGGWGESPESYSDPAQRGRGRPTPSQTAWAVLGLLAAGGAALPAARRGIGHLLATQQSDGTWHEPEFTGTGFPLVFYLRYHMYPLYFPLLALAKFASRP